MNNNGQSKEKVNLLPEDLRKKEEEELKKIRKNSRVIEVKMSDPKRGFTFKEEKTQKGPGFWRSLFKSKSSLNLGGVQKNFASEQGSEMFKERETEEIANLAEQRIKKPSWWKRIFGTSEEKERKRMEKLALMRAREEAMHRQREAKKRAKIEEKMRRQQEQRLLLEKRLQKKKEAEESHRRMRELSSQEKREEEERHWQEKEKAKLLANKVKSEPPPVKPVSKPLSPPPPPKHLEKLERKDKEKIIRTEPPPENKTPSLEVNLIPEELLKIKELKFSHQLLNLSGLVVLTLLVVGAVYGLLVWYQINITNKIKVVDGQIQTVNSEIDEYKQFKEEAVGYQRQLKDLESLLNRHLYWTQFFNLLAAHTIPQIYYQDIAADADRGSVILSAVAKNYESLARQLAAFQQADDLVENVSITSAAAQLDERGMVSEVSFNINLILKPKVFLKTE